MDVTDVKGAVEVVGEFLNRSTDDDRRDVERHPKLVISCDEAHKF